MDFKEIIKLRVIWNSSQGSDIRFVEIFNKSLDEIFQSSRVVFCRLLVELHFFALGCGKLRSNFVQKSPVELELKTSSLVVSSEIETLKGFREERDEMGEMKIAELSFERSAKLLMRPSSEVIFYKKKYWHLFKENTAIFNDWNEAYMLAGPRYNSRGFQKP